jgi:hypothetical protein
MIEAFREYLMGGFRGSMGFNPLTAAELADTTFKSGATPTSGSLLQLGPKVFHFNANDPFKMPEIVGSVKNWKMSAAGSAFAVGSTAYMAYTGYQENGVSGLKDALVWDVAVNSAVMSSYTDGPNLTKELMPGRFTMTGVAARQTGAIGTVGKLAGGFKTFAGAGIGASLGQEVLGTPGAFAGAYLGARMGRGTSSLVIAAGAAFAYAGSEVVKKGGAILKAGYVNQQMRRRIDTAGSMASFMTQNAYTERSRAVQAMHRSHLNARSALGGEAGYLHMNRDYFSNYKRF